MREVKCLTIYLIVVLCSAFFMTLYLFADFFYKIIQESFAAEDWPKPPDGLERPLVIGIFSLTFLSIATYAVFMLGLHILQIWLMMPWALVIGLKCIAGGVLLIYASSFVSSWTLLQGIVNYATTVLSFIAIYYCCIRMVINKKKLAQESEPPIVDKISIISVKDEKPKTIV